MSDMIEDEGPNSKGVAFALWLACLLGVSGLHRFYLGRPVTGVIWMLTWGLVGVGQFVDLILLPRMVAKENTKHAALQALAEKRALTAMQQRMLPPGQPGALPAAPMVEEAPEQFRQKLLQAAARRRGRLTVAQGVMSTGKTFEEVERELDSMTGSGHVSVDNDPRTGVIVYDFGDLGEENEPREAERIAAAPVTASLPPESGTHAEASAAPPRSDPGADDRTSS